MTDRQSTALLVNIDVPDLQAAVRFYTAATDLRLLRELGDGVALLVGPGGSRVHLIERPEGSPTSASATATSATLRNYQRHWTPVHLDFVVPELEPAIRRALLAGAQPDGVSQSWRGATWASFADPFGHGFCLISFAHGGYE